MKYLNYGICLSAIAFLTGCMPYPHTTPRGPAAWGRILDVNTHAPIQGAKIFYFAPPEHAVYTDKNGYFHIKATHNFVLVVGSDGEWPNEKPTTMGISHTNYVTIVLCCSGNAGDIYLTPANQ